MLGYRAIKTIRAGDLLPNRDEWDANEAVEAKLVEEVFERFALVLRLRIELDVPDDRDDGRASVLGAGSWVNGSEGLTGWR
ncbi:MAG: hypothetical protein RMJ88_16145 [Thermogemmata sp.]|nr:hypothetical protein [Thermogemmata sp.]